MPISVRHSSAAQTNINRDRALDSGSFRNHAGSQRYLDSSNNRSSGRDSEGEVNFEPDSCADLCHGDKGGGPAGISGFNSIQRANLARTSPEAEGKDCEIILDKIPSSAAATTQHGLISDFTSNVQSSLQKIISKKPPLAKLGSAIAPMPPAEERLLEGQIDKVRWTVLYLWDRDWHHRGAFFVSADNVTIATLLGGAAVGEALTAYILRERLYRCHVLLDAVAPRLVYFCLLDYIFCLYLSENISLRAGWRFQYIPC